MSEWVDRVYWTFSSELHFTVCWLGHCWQSIMLCNSLETNASRQARSWVQSVWDIENSVPQDLAQIYSILSAEQVAATQIFTCYSSRDLTSTEQRWRQWETKREVHDQAEHRWQGEVRWSDCNPDQSCLHKQAVNQREERCFEPLLYQKIQI